MKKLIYTVFSLLVGVAAVQAGLNDPVLTNPSFESPALAVGAGANGIVDWYDSSAYTFTQDDAASTHPDTPYGENWAEFGNERWMYQQIGTYEENMDLDVTFLLGCRTDKDRATLHVSLLAGGNPALAADVNSKYYAANPLETVVGATLIDSLQIAALSSAGTTAEKTANLSTGTGRTAGEPLWLQFHIASTTSRTLIDYVDINSSLPSLPSISSFTATPSEIDAGDSVTLAWSTANATGLSIDQGIGDVTGLTSTQLIVNAATTFSLIAANAEGSTTSSVPVSILQYPPVIQSFTATDLGNTIELAWETTGADTLSIDNGIGNVTGITSTQVVDNAVGSYTLTATNGDGSTMASAKARPLAASGPNVVFVLVDDWGWTDHSNTNAAMGHQSLYFETPNFERLVEAGVAFTSAYAQPNCAPTRAALLTGQYSCRTGNGVYNVTSLNRAGSSRTTYTTPANQGDEHINGDEQTITIGEAFINSGYVTAHFGKYHAGASDVDDPTYPINQGFDYNYGGKNDGAPGAYHALDTTPRTFHSRIGPELYPFAEDYDLTYISNNLIPYANGNDPTTLVGTKKHLTDAMADAFVSFMNDHQGGSMSNYPVYAQVHFYAVHGPIQPRSDLETKYDNITPPPGSTHTESAYAALIEGMDHSLGRIIDYLNDPNGDGDPSDSITENTLLVFCSDNGGTAASNEPLRNKKGTHFEGGVRVPCVISMPGTVPTNTVSDTLVHVVDFYPTMLDFAEGVFPNSVTHPLDGVSMHNHLLDPDNNARNREPIFYHFPGYMDTRAYACSVVIKEIDGKRFKYIYSYDPYYEPSDSYDQYQLYNITDDISETVNLLDYIDEENSGDPGDPSTTEEYWNYILYKDIGDQLASDLNSWIIGDPGDATWNPIHVTYKSNYPGIAPELIGEEVAPPPAAIPELEIPEGQVFRVMDASGNTASQELTMEFNSEPGFNYAVQASTNLVDWTTIASNIAGQVNSTIKVIDDPALATENSRFYRAVLMAD